MNAHFLFLKFLLFIPAQE